MDYQEVILDMLNRIIKLEKEVKMIKNDALSQNTARAESFNDCKGNISEENAVQRDKTRYMFDGNVYLKNKLVLAILHDYVKNHPLVKCAELKTIFDKSLQGSIGVVEYEYIAIQRYDYQIRFFSKESDILRLSDGNMLVCSQWGILNITNFIIRARQLGYKIEQILNK